MRVLLVEDDKPLRDLLTMRLESDDFQVHSAENGKMALSLCQDHPVDLILLDINLPDILGIELLDIIRKDKNKALSSL